MTDANVTNDLRAAAARIEAARFAEDLYGDILGPSARTEERLRALGNAFRRLASAVHPDRHPSPPESDIAHDAFVRATALRAEAEAKLRRGTYGDRAAVPDATGPVVVTSRRRTYIVGDRIGSPGTHDTRDVADVYACTYDDRGEERPAVFKIAASAGDSDLVENEARVIEEILPAHAPESGFFRYFPRLLDAFAVEGSSGARRWANVLPAFEGYVSLAEVHAAHPAGLDFRDVAWMLKRLLAAIGFSHRRGFVHGAIVPALVLVHPKHHGARIVDWCYAVPIGTRIRAFRVADEALYAPEILRRTAVGPATDIYMAAACATLLLGGDAARRSFPSDVPEPLARFLRTCLAPSGARRPDDAWNLHEDLDGLLERLVGRRTYRPLVMPKKP